MTVSRRAWLGTLAIGAAGGLTGRAALALGAAPDRSNAATISNLLTKADFNLGARTYLNAASTHPLSIHAAAAMRAYVDDRAGIDVPQRPRVDPRTQFAQLINAHPHEVAVVQSTSVGENYVVTGLGLRGSTSRVVTDTGHFMGSLYMYDELARGGLDVQVVRPRGNVIDLDDIAARIDSRTRLIAVSLVSMTTGFMYDLKALCALAHARGVLVYVEAVQAIGSLHVDVRDSNVDFLATSTYKWLMGDFGAGFLYVREDHLERLGRPVYGYEQVEFDMNRMPYDPVVPAGPFKQRQTARGHFEIGSEASVVLAAAKESMTRIAAMGITRIAQQRRPLIDFVRRELEPHGFMPLAPPSDAALACFAYPDADAKLSARLESANVAISVYQNRVRISPSVYNTMADVERLVDVLTSRSTPTSR